MALRKYTLEFEANIDKNKNAACDSIYQNYFITKFRIHAIPDQLNMEFDTIIGTSKFRSQLFKI